MSQQKAGAYVRSRKQVESAYSAFVAGEEGASEALFSVIREFALAKASSSLYDLRELSQTADDLAQEVVIHIWEKLGEFRGDVENFYPWLNRICYTTGANAVNNGLKETSLRVDLTIVDEDGYVDDNPEIYPQPKRPEYQRPLPDFIVGDDFRICGYIRDGLEYGAIAKRLDISVGAVKQKIARMKRKILASRNEVSKPPSDSGASVLSSSELDQAA